MAYPLHAACWLRRCYLRLLPACVCMLPLLLIVDIYRPYLPCCNNLTPPRPSTVLTYAADLRATSKHKQAVERQQPTTGAALRCRRLSPCFFFSYPPASHALPHFPQTPTPLCRDDAAATATAAAAAAAAASPAASPATVPLLLPSLD
jgi:hypothetical protein